MHGFLPDWMLWIIANWQIVCFALGFIALGASIPLFWFLFYKRLGAFGEDKA